MNGLNSIHMRHSLMVLALISLLPVLAWGKGKTVTTNSNMSKNNSNTVIDVDSNVYHTVKIGKQTWMLENLRVTRFRNGKPLFNIKDSVRWSILNTAAFCSYNNDSSLVKTHGYLYNWYAVADTQKICPKGWHVPSDADWNILEEYLGGTTVCGGKMKDTSSVWQNSLGGTNESGYCGFPSGCRTNKGVFNSFGYYGLWWSSTENYTSYAWYRCINYNSTDLFRHYYYKRYGFSIRCLKD